MEHSTSRALRLHGGPRGFHVVYVLVTVLFTQLELGGAQTGTTTPKRHHHLKECQPTITAAFRRSGQESRYHV
eukprot:1196171-Prorocentrum_minimum.AAC.5